MTSKAKTITSAVVIMQRRFYKNAERRRQLEDARINAEAARLIYKLRTEAKLSQSQLADLIGTTQSVVSRLEDDDYDGHSLTMLSKITAALNMRLVLRAVKA